MVGLASSCIKRTSNTFKQLSGAKTNEADTDLMTFTIFSLT